MGGRTFKMWVWYLGYLWSAFSYICGIDWRWERGDARALRELVNQRFCPR